MPGSIIANMPPRDDDPQRRARDAQRLAREQASAKSGQAMQIGAGGIDVTDGGSITIEGTGALHVGSGALDSAGSITAGTDITAGGTVQGADVVSTGGASVAGAVSAASVSTSGNVVASGHVESNGAPFLSVPSHNYYVTSNYVACWINDDGQFGTSSSSQLVKTSLTVMSSTDVQKLLSIPAYWGRYVWDDPTSPLKVFLLAEDVAAAGFGPDVAPVALADMLLTMPDGTPILNPDGTQCTIPAGNAYTVNYSQLVVPLLAAYQNLDARLKALGG